MLVFWVVALPAMIAMNAMAAIAAPESRDNQTTLSPSPNYRDPPVVLGSSLNP